ncbi:MAG TPA: ABC transporter ATP-binding protein [Clostridiaceae bacterium]|nr:ABC transporter ATP-binding protein [Clostridiaceae bacterium]
MRKTYQQLKWFLQLYRRQYVLAILLILASYAASLIPLRLVGYMSDRIVAGTMMIPELVRLVVMMLGLTVLLYVVTYFWQLYTFKASDVIAFETRKRLVRKYLAQSPPFFQRNSTGSLMGKATNDVSSLETLAGFGVMSLIDATIYPFSLLVIMATTLSWKLTLFSIVPLPLLIFLSTKLGAVYNRRYDEAQQAFDEMNERVLENIAGVRVLRAFGQQAAEEAGFSGSAEHLYEKHMAVARLEALFPALSRVVPALSYVVAIVLGAHYVGIGEMTSGELVSFVIFLNMLAWPMLALGEFINILEQGSASLDRIEELTFYKEDVSDRPGAVPYAGGGDIVFDGLDFCYPDTGTDVLKDIRFTLRSGQTLGLVGPVGSGKTTLLKQLLRFYPLERGRVLLGGRPLEDYSIDSVRAAVGYVPQQHVLFSRTIAENIRMGEQCGSGLSLDEAVELADFAKDLPQLPAGLNTLAGEKGVALSGGQKQRIQIARALIAEPEILILDDSLSAVDAQTQEKLLAALRRTRRGKTTLISAHRLSAVMHADLILVLDDGCIAEHGTHHELMAYDNWYKAQFLRQQLEQEAVHARA